MNNIKQKQFYTVYKTTNLINGKYYIGFHSTNDLNDTYLGSGKILKDAIVLYGKENFKREIIQIFDNQKDAEALERELVNQEFIASDDNYNISLGGNICILFGENNGFYGKKHKKETIHKIQEKLNEQREEINNKISMALKEFYSTPESESMRDQSRVNIQKALLQCKTKEALENLSNALKGRKLSEETKHKISLSKLGKPIGPFTDEHKEKISNALIGRKSEWVADKINRNPEKIRKTADKHRGMKRSEKAKKNIKASKCKYIYHTSYGIFISSTDFEKETHLSETLLLNRCVRKNDNILKASSLNKAHDLTIEEKLLHIGKTWKEMGWWRETKEDSNNE